MKKTNKTISKILLLLSLFLYVTEMSQAQVKIGPKVGMTFSKIHQTLDHNETYFLNHSDKLDKKHITFGLSTQLKLKEKWYLQADFFYAQKGTNVIDRSGTDAPIFNYESKYVDVNLQISYHPLRYTFFEIVSLL